MASPAPTDDPYPPGTELVGRYRIERKLGAGDQKAVYLAHDPVIGRDVAISLLDPRKAADDALAELRHEMRVLGELGMHQGIVGVLDARDDPDLLMFVSPHMAGGDLADRAAGGISVAEVVRLGTEVADALAFVHEQGWVHRDVKPGNVWLDANGRAHLGDFDLAVRVGEQDDSAPQPTRVEFSAPEVLLGGEPATPASDVFSLGATLFKLATGTVPFPDKRNRTAEPPSMGEIKPTVPEVLDGVVATMLRPDPLERPTAREVATALQGVGTMDTPQSAESLRDLISRGESERLEFKSSLLTPIDPATRTSIDLRDLAREEVSALRARLEHSVAKTIAAMLNTQGGTLLVGVADDGAIIGIETDAPSLRSKSGSNPLDAWLLRFGEILKNWFDPALSGFVSMTLVPIDGVHVARVTMPPGRRPTWVVRGDGSGAKNVPPALYVRNGAESVEQTGQALLTYCMSRWSGLG